MKTVYLSHINGRVDYEKGIVRGVSVITEGQARGHDLVIDSKTVEQMFHCCKGASNGRVKTKLNHRSGIESVFGYLSTFRVEGPKLLADLTLLKKHKDYDQTLEQIREMPESIGLSVAFTGQPVPGQNGVKVARVERIVSADLVPEPAANPTGLFEEPMIGEEVDSLEKSEMDPIQEVLEKLTAISERMDSYDGRFDAIENAIQEPEGSDEELTEEEVASAVENLREQGYDDNEIEAIISSEIDDFYGEGEEGEDEGEEGEQEGEGEAAQGQDADRPSHPSYAGKDRLDDHGEAARAAEPAGVNGGGDDEGGGEFSRLERMVTNLEAKLVQKEASDERDQLDHAFGEVRDQIVELSLKNDDLSTQLDAAQEALYTGSPAVGASGPAKDITLSEGAFEDIVRNHISSGKKKNEAIALASKDNKVEHLEWLKRNGVFHENMTLGTQA